MSQSTAALDLVQLMCDARGLKTARIDGATDVNKRQAGGGWGAGWTEQAWGWE